MPGDSRRSAGSRARQPPLQTTSHPVTVAELGAAGVSDRLREFIDGRRLELVTGGLRASQYAPIDKRSLEGRGPLDVSGPVRQAQNHLWFPTMKFNMLPGHPNLSIGPLWPTGPDTCSGYLDDWFGDEADAEWIDTLFTLDDQIGAEDTGLVEAVQRGVSSGIVERGWVMGGTETLIGHFQDYVRARLGLDFRVG